MSQHARDDCVGTAVTCRSLSNMANMHLGLCLGNGDDRSLLLIFLLNRSSLRGDNGARPSRGNDRASRGVSHVDLIDRGFWCLSCRDLLRKPGEIGDEDAIDDLWRSSDRVRGCLLRMRRSLKMGTITLCARSAPTLTNARL